MDETLFRKYETACEYAKKRAASSGTETEVERSGDVWLVRCTAGSQFEDMDDVEGIFGYDAPTPEIREPEMSEQQILQSKENYKRAVAMNNWCPHFDGLDSGSQICSICKAKRAQRHRT